MLYIMHYLVQHDLVLQLRYYDWLIIVDCDTVGMQLLSQFGVEKILIKKLWYTTPFLIKQLHGFVMVLAHTWFRKASLAK